MAGHRSTPTNQLSTGDDVLDRKLGGGIQAGSLLVVQAPPGSQSTALVYTLMRRCPSLFISTIRRESAVRHDFNRVFAPDADYEVASVVEERTMDGQLVKEITGGRTLSTDLTDRSTMLDDVCELIRGVDGQTNVVIDATTPLERAGEAKAYQTMLNDLKSQVMKTDALGVLQCADHDDNPTLRERTLAIADVVWTLQPVMKSGEQKYHLKVVKNRASSIVREKIELTLNRFVSIDDTRNI